MDTDPLSSSSLTVRFVAHPGYLEAVLTGFASHDGAMAVVARIAQEIRQRGAARVLINALDILGQASHYDHQRIGAAIAHAFGSTRCALVAPAPKVQGVLGAAAVARGADYRGFSDMTAALDWLCASR